MDRNRHEADSKYKYSLYFDLLEWKISEYLVLPENTYQSWQQASQAGLIFIDSGKQSTCVSVHVDTSQKMI
jgi:hypothetical protein